MAAARLHRLLDSYTDAGARLAKLRFGPPAAHVYNPLAYAAATHQAYLRKYGRTKREVILLGMNPGPWGMAQTGVPFGEVSSVRTWLKIDAPVGRPADEHPKKPVQGLDCPRSEVSGARLWGWARDTFGTPQRFFARFFVANYCPLMFLEDSGRNLTPDRLPAAQKQPLEDICDNTLREIVEYFQPRLVIGVGKFAERRARTVLDDVEIGGILHPSPASPIANRGWAAQATAQLRALGVDLS